MVTLNYELPSGDGDVGVSRVTLHVIVGATFLSATAEIPSTPPKVRTVKPVRVWVWSHTPLQ